MSSRQSDRRPLPTTERLKELFVYDSTLGLLRWKVTRGPARAGSVAGHPCKRHGRRVVRVDYVLYRHARVVYAFHKGDPGAWEVDHIDRDKLNDRIENLRIVRTSENQVNTGLRSTNKSGYKGVHWFKPISKWTAGIMVEGKAISLGYFDKLEDAAAARKAAELKYLKR